MKKVVAFAGSNSTKSINKQLIQYTSGLFGNAKVEILDLNDFELPLFGVDYERENGIPENAHLFFKHIEQADGVLISMAEHNGAYSAVFKNLLDWVSRIEVKWFGHKPIMLMATSPGARGGFSVLELARDRFPRHDAQLAATFSLPSFNDNFKDGAVVNKDYDTLLKQAVKNFEAQL